MQLSVIIPVHNEEYYLEQALISLVSQNHPPDEIIVVDNNSTDDSVSIARKFNVRVIQETKQGIIHARNCGFNHARGLLIARCDSDSRPPLDWTANIIQVFEDPDIDAASGPVSYYDLPLSTPHLANLYQKMMLTYQKHPTLLGPNMILRRRIWNKVKHSICLDDQLVHEDIDLAIHIYQMGGKIVFDQRLISATSARRIKKNPLSFFVEYPFRLAKTLRHH